MAASGEREHKRLRRSKPEYYWKQMEDEFAEAQYPKMFMKVKHLSTNARILLKMQEIALKKAVASGKWQETGEGGRGKSG